SKDESSKSDDESSESDEEGNESDAYEETTPVENKNCKVDKFWSMPPLLKTPVFDLKKKEVMSESSRIYRGKEIMTDMKARGTHEESFAELPLYFHNLKVKNPGTITHIEPHDQDRFKIFFLAVGAAILAMDGNNQILPLAYGVGKSETFRS
nr:hypothetical protein [Tanacetum cinerariifolium]